MLAGRGLAALAPLGSLAHGQGQGHWRSEVADRRGGRSGEVPRTQPGHRRPPPAAGGARAGRRHQRRAGQRRHDRRARRAAHRGPDRGYGAAGRAGRGDRRRHRRHPGDHGDEPGLRRAGRPQAAAAAQARPQHHLLHALRGRDGRGLQHDRPGRPRARELGRRPRHRRRCLGHSAAHRPALERLQRGRAPGRVPGRGRRRGARAAAALLARPGQGAPRRLRRHLGDAGWPTAWFPTPSPAPNRGSPSTPARWSRRSRRCWRRPRPGWRSRSRSTPRSTTGGSPTTPGCRSCPTRSPS